MPKKKMVVDSLPPSMSEKSEIAEQSSHYTRLIDAEGRTYVGRIRELPGVFASGQSREHCAKALEFALETTLLFYLRDGVTPPRMIDRNKRTEQVNIRLSPMERDSLAAESDRRGFRGLGDFIRAIALENVAKSA